MSRYSFASHHSVIGVLFFFCFFLHPVAWEVAPLNLKDPLCAGIGWERGPWINPVRMRNELLERRNLFARF